MPDGENDAQLFNGAACKKAKFVLAEILMWRCEDPTGMQFYFQSLDIHGKPAAFDKYDNRE